MTMHPFNLQLVHPTWLESIHAGLSQMDPAYLNALRSTDTWLPGPKKIFSAFSLPMDQVNYVLFGESPYPRMESANGYAFWDAAVKELWSPTGLDKKVNRATSLRNLLKMLLVAEKLLSPDHLGQDAIAKINKSSLIQTNDLLFAHLLEHGFLLLNATLVLQSGSPHKDAKAWYPFMRILLKNLLKIRPHVECILFGRIANTIETLVAKLPIKKLYAEHPYNLTFITNPTVLSFFQPLHLLRV